MLRACVRGGLGEDRRTHFILDEAASLGKLECLEDAVDKYAGYGVRMTFVYQSMAQLKLCWREGADVTVVSNCTCIFFGVNDKETRTYVSEMLGKETILHESTGTNSGNSTSQNTGSMGGSLSDSRGRSRNWQAMARELLTSDEVASLPRDVAITFTRGVPPICTRMTPYFEVPAARTTWRAIRYWFDVLVLSIVPPVALLALGMWVAELNPQKGGFYDVQRSPEGSVHGSERGSGTAGDTRTQRSRTSPVPRGR
jgi:type IV secretion system protein VirD4